MNNIEQDERIMEDQAMFMSMIWFMKVIGH